MLTGEFRLWCNYRRAGIRTQERRTELSVVPLQPARSCHFLMVQLRRCLWLSMRWLPTSCSISPRMLNFSALLVNSKSISFSVRRISGSDFRRRSSSRRLRPTRCRTRWILRQWNYFNDLKKLLLVQTEAIYSEKFSVRFLLTNIVTALLRLKVMRLTKVSYRIRLLANQWLEQKLSW